MVVPPIGGRNTLRSGRVTSSGYMPPVCSWQPRRRSLSERPKRSAMPGRYQTGSIAAFTTRTLPAADTMSPSARTRRAVMAARISGMSIWARVTAMVGRTS